MSGSDPAHLARVRDNQRRSRARRKEYLQEVEGRLRECEQTGVAASAEIQAAARKVAEENSRLRLLLIRHGVNPDEITMFLNNENLAAEDGETWAVDALKSDDAIILDTLLQMGEKRPCCAPGTARQLSVSYIQAQDPTAPNYSKLGSTPDSWSDSPTTTHQGPQIDRLRQQTSLSPSSTLEAVPQQIPPTSTALPHPISGHSREPSFHHSPQIHQSLAPSMATSMAPPQYNIQVLASMPSNQHQSQYQFQSASPYPPAQQFQSQPMQQRAGPVFQQPVLSHIEYAEAATRQAQTPYGHSIGTNSCVYATDLITSMARNAHPGDVRNDLGCSSQCADCEVDNRTVFDVIDRYSGVQQT